MVTHEQLEPAPRRVGIGPILAFLGVAWPLVTVAVMALYAQANRPDPGPYPNPAVHATATKDAAVYVLIAGAAISAIGIAVARRPFRAFAAAGLVINLLLAGLLATLMF